MAAVCSRSVIAHVRGASRCACPRGSCEHAAVLYARARVLASVSVSVLITYRAHLTQLLWLRRSFVWVDMTRTHASAKALGSAGRSPAARVGLGRVLGHWIAVGYASLGVTRPRWHPRTALRSLPLRAELASEVTLIGGFPRPSRYMCTE